MIARTRTRLLSERPAIAPSHSMIRLRCPQARTHPSAVPILQHQVGGQNVEHATLTTGTRRHRTQCRSRRSRVAPMINRPSVEMVTGLPALKLYVLCFTSSGPPGTRAAVEIREIERKRDVRNAGIQIATRQLQCPSTTGGGGSPWSGWNRVGSSNSSLMHCKSAFPADRL